MIRRLLFYHIKILALYLLLVSFIILPDLASIHAREVAPPSLSAIKNISVISGKPVRLQIPRLHIDVAVLEGSYSQQNWTLTADTAFFATISALPNNSTGNTVIYGHNTPAVFWPTQSLKAGDEVIVFTDRNSTFIYTYQSSEYVLPTDTAVFSQKNAQPQLILLTCNGFFDEKRRLMYFSLSHVFTGAL